MVRAVLSSLVLIVTLVLPAAGQDAARRDQVTHLLQRATWGVRPQDIEAALSAGISTWLDRQLSPATIADSITFARLQAFPSLNREMTDAVTEFQRLQRERMRRQQEDQPTRPPVRPDSMRGQPRELNPQLLLLDLTSAKVTRAAYTERQLEDVMTDFWYNHFNVFFGKGMTRFMVADYEARAIRPHVFGRFRDMLGATARHPAMLFYLDNATSIAPDTTNFRVPAMLRTRGLNENYARELLELHTLGVDAGYTQVDVINVARAFTGWTFRRPGPRSAGRIEFQFAPVLHDRGSKTVLGRTLAAGRGPEDGEDVLDLLARHPATARHIAGKLVERFVSDTPDSAFVEEIAAVFTRTDGDLRAVTRALFTSDRFYNEKVRRGKVKTPFEVVVSSLRATGADVGRSRAIVQTLRSLGHLPYNAEAPTGYPAAAEDWVNSGAMLGRMNFGLAFAAGRLDGVRVNPRALTGAAAGHDPDALVPVLLKRLLPGADAARLQTTILTELASVESTGSAHAVRALGLALGSPDFQRK